MNKKDKKRVDLDIRPYPSPMFRNYDYTDNPDEEGPGPGLFHGPMDRYKSVREFLDEKEKKRNKEQRKNALFNLLYDILCQKNLKK